MDGVELLPLPLDRRKKEGGKEEEREWPSMVSMEVQEERDRPDAS